MSAPCYTATVAECPVCGEESMVVLDTVGALLGYTRADLYGTGRSGGVALARQIVMYLLRAEGLSFPEIGKVLRRDHTTVMAGCKRIEMLLGSNDPRARRVRLAIDVWESKRGVVVDVRRAVGVHVRIAV